PRGPASCTPITSKLKDSIKCNGQRYFFFFQAEDDIRDADVTGVQTCALPIRSEEHTSELQSRPHLVCRIIRSEEHTSELQSRPHLVCRLLLEKKKKHRETDLVPTDTDTARSAATGLADD